MCKFDTSSGLTKNQIQIIKYAVKNKILGQLPILPEPVETRLFFEGRDAWVFSWSLNRQERIESKDEITLDVMAKLKKEFHQYNAATHYKFSCKVKLRQDIYRSEVTITKTCKKE